MATMYEKDVDWVAAKLAIQYLRRLIVEHHLEDDLEEQRALLRRVCLVRTQVMLAKRLQARGHEIVRGENPVERATLKRMKEKFFRCLVSTIQRESDRLDRSGYVIH